MRILSLKLLVLLSTPTMKSNTFTAFDYADEVIEKWPKWFDPVEDHDTQNKRVRATISSMVRDGLLMMIGTEPTDHGVVRGLYCFTDKGRKERVKASRTLNFVLDGLLETVEDDMHEEIPESKLAYRQLGRALDVAEAA